MNVNEILGTIDAEITRLRQVRALLSGAESATPKAKTSAIKPRRKKRTMSAEGRARIAEAQRKRWAAQKKAAK